MTIRRRRKVSASLRYKQQAAIGIGQTRQQARDARDRMEQAARNVCRAMVYARDGGRCVRCGRALVLQPQDARHVFDVAHIHERIPRSLGGSPYDPLNCETLCAKCHIGGEHS
jgi:5-methylcytosine-specific restriction endonuclease McrA